MAEDAPLPTPSRTCYLPFVPGWSARPLEEVLRLAQEPAPASAAPVAAAAVALPPAVAPTAASAAPSPPPPPIPAFPGGLPRRVLVVDDKPMTRLILVQVLKQVGHEVIALDQADCIVEEVERLRPDLVFLDVMMPGRDGFEACRLLKQHPDLRKIPVVICTARSGKADVLRAREAGADSFVVKPFARDVILRKVKELTRSAPGSPKPP